jgi:hypothetical protein
MMFLLDLSRPSRENPAKRATQPRHTAGALNSAKSLTCAWPERYARNARFREPKMTVSDAESPQSGGNMAQPAQLPMLWIGYLLGVATIVAELVAVGLDPDLAKKGGIPPLYLFLVSFIGGVYWLVCIYQIHVVLAHAPRWRHPISPARAVGFHFIPFYQFYWIFKWPREIANFVSSRLPEPIMKPAAVGVAILAALILRLVDPGFGLILLFFPMSYVSECIRRAFAATPVQSGDSPPTSP